MNPGTTTRQPSWARVALLVALGVTIGVAFTAPGRFATRRWMNPIGPPLDVRVPLRLDAVSVTSADSRFRDLYRAVRDVDAGDDAEGDAARAALAPTPERVAERLARIDGWSTAVLFEPGSSPGALRDAGLDDTTTCVVLSGLGTGYSRPSFLDERPMLPLRSWWLVLLDGSGREIGKTVVHAVRPGLAHSESSGRQVFVPAAGTADEAALRAVCVFHRGASGEVLPG